MRKFYLFLFLVLAHLSAFTQTITVSGQCMTGTITLNRIADIDGRVAYEGTGTVAGSSGVSIAIYWIGAPDNVWVLAFDGQPYFQSACNRTTPPSTANATCSWTTVPGESCTGAAPLAIAGTGTLPVKLSSFTATKAGSQVQLNWKTQSETNNKGFDVQRSADGLTWASIGFVNGNGNSSQEKSYDFTDAAPIQGKNYYRLLQFDYDGRSAASATVMADISVNGFYTLQNSGNGLYQLQLKSDDPVVLTIVDMNGKKLFSKTAAQGLHPVDVTPYAKGIYLLQLRKGNLVQTEKLIKQ